MAQLISVIDTSYKVPRAFIQVSLGVGPRSPGSSAIKILLVGLKTGSGSAAVGELKLLAGEDDAKAYHGPGSELHLMAKAVFKANPIGTVYAIAMDGSGGTAGTKALVFSGTATADGVVEVWVRGERVAAQVASGMTATQVGDAVAAAINARTDFPCTAANVSGTVTLTAKNTGVRSAGISCRSLASVAGITHTGVTGYFSAGTAGSENATTQLDAIASQRFHYIVSPHFDSTNLLKFKSFTTSQSGPIAGKRCKWFACFNGSLASLITLSDAVNDKRGELAWMENPDDLPCMVAAAYAGAAAAVRSSDRAYNTDGLLLTGIKPQFAIADIPTETEQNSALNNGASPLLAQEGEVRIVRAVTNYHNDSSGNDDFTVLDAHYVDVCDYVADLLQDNFATAFKGFKLAPDNADGEPPDARVATPNSIRDWIYLQLKALENRQLVNVDALLPSLVVEIDGTTPTRANADVPVDPIELFHQLAANVAQL